MPNTDESWTLSSAPDEQKKRSVSEPKHITKYFLFRVRESISWLRRPSSFRCPTINSWIETTNVNELVNAEYSVESELPYEKRNGTTSSIAAEEKIDLKIWLF